MFTSQPGMRCAPFVPGLPRPGLPRVGDADDRPSSLRQLFPREGEIPEEHRLQAPIHQRTYLVNGVLKAWDGKRNPVHSPVCLRNARGEAQPIEIGSYPLMGEPESDEALEAAVAAYDNGRGAWPTMSVGRAHRLHARTSPGKWWRSGARSSS